MLNHFQVGHELFPSRHSSQAGPFFKTKTMGNWGSQNCYRVALCQFTNALKLWAGLEKSCVDVLTWKPVDRSGANGVFFIATSAILIAWSGLFLNITILLFYSHCKWICQTWAGWFGRTAFFSILTPNMNDSFQSLTPKDQTENILTWKKMFQVLFIRPEFDHWLCLSLTHWQTHSLTHCRIVNLIDMPLPCKDANSKLVEVVTVADVDDEKRFDDSFMQFWKLKFGHKAKFCSHFEHKVWPRVWSWSSSETFETEVWSVFCCWGLVRLWSECLVKILMLKFGRNADVWLRFWILEFDQNLCKNLLLW